MNLLSALRLWRIMFVSCVQIPWQSPPPRISSNQPASSAANLDLIGGGGAQTSLRALWFLLPPLRLFVRFEIPPCVEGFSLCSEFDCFSLFSLRFNFVLRVSFRSFARNDPHHSSALSSNCKRIHRHIVICSLQDPQFRFWGGYYASEWGRLALSSTSACPSLVHIHQPKHTSRRTRYTRRNCVDVVRLCVVFLVYSRDQLVSSRKSTIVIIAY